jgi:hypothetical protein
MPWAIMSRLLFPAARLSVATRAVRFTARCRNTLGLVAAVIIVVPVAFPPGISSTVLVAIPLVLVAISLVLDVLFVVRCGTTSAACPRGPHRVAPLTKPLAQRVDLAADRGNGSCLPGIDKTAFYLVGQLGELRRRGEQLGALLDQATRAAGQFPAASQRCEAQRPLHLVKSAQQIPRRDGKAHAGSGIHRIPL